MDPSDIAAAAKQITDQKGPAAAQTDTLIGGMTFGGLMANILFSGIGFVYFKYGRSTEKPAAIITGIVLMIYPYFVSDTLYMVLIGLGIMLAHWLIAKYA